MLMGNISIPMSYTYIDTTESGTYSVFEWNLGIMHIFGAKFYNLHFKPIFIFFLPSQKIANMIALHLRNIYFLAHFATIVY